MLRGIIAYSRGSEIVLDVGGVGYRVTCLTPYAAFTDEVISPQIAGARSWSVGEEITLWIHTHVREDAIVLYGFGTRPARDRFEDLLAAHGVGPSLALSVLTVLSPEDLVACVLAEDATLLSTVPGIGKKTALRLIIDLKSKFETLGPQMGGTSEHLGPSGLGAQGGSPALVEAKAALAELGYSQEEIRQATNDLGAELDSGELLKQALKELAGSRR